MIPKHRKRLKLLASKITKNVTEINQKRSEQKRTMEEKKRCNWEMKCYTGHQPASEEITSYLDSEFGVYFYTSLKEIKS